MPIVAHNDLPTLQRLRSDGTTIVLPAERAANQDIRELHIGLLNMMPDAALEATERQFFRLVGESNPIAQFYVHPFTLDAIPRGEKGPCSNPAPDAAGWTNCSITSSSTAPNSSIAAMTGWECPIPVPRQMTHAEAAAGTTAASLIPPTNSQSHLRQPSRPKAMAT